MKPTQTELRNRFDYDQETGILTTKDRGVGRGFRRGGKQAGCLRSDGYVHVQTGPKSYYAHCLIWCWMTGDWPSLEVDHIDLDRSNNRWNNLRLATSSQNAFARRTKRLNRGIEVLPNGKYRAHIGYGRNKIHLGCFADLDDAKAAYHESAVRLFGEFAQR